MEIVPKEILLHMFSFFDEKTALNVRLVCHKFKSIIDPDRLWSKFGNKLVVTHLVNPNASINFETYKDVKMITETLASKTKDILSKNYGLFFTDSKISMIFDQKKSNDVFTYDEVVRFHAIPNINGKWCLMLCFADNTSQSEMINNKEMEYYLFKFNVLKDANIIKTPFLYFI